MKIEAAPVKIMAAKMMFLDSGGKALLRLAADQSSVTRDATRRTGMVRTLL